MGILDPYIGTKEERKRLYECFRKSLNTKLKPTKLIYGIYCSDDERVTFKWLEPIYQSTSNDGNDGTGGCWGGTPNPKLCIDFKHELTSPFIGWMAEEFQAFEAMCLEKVGFDDLERFDESR
jgi:hypothetical protein